MHLPKKNERHHPLDCDSCETTHCKVPAAYVNFQKNDAPFHHFDPLQWHLGWKKLRCLDETEGLMIVTANMATSMEQLNVCSAQFGAHQSTHEYLMYVWGIHFLLNISTWEIGVTPTFNVSCFVPLAISSVWSLPGIIQHKDPSIIISQALAVTYHNYFYHISSSVLLIVIYYPQYWPTMNQPWGIQVVSPALPSHLLLSVWGPQLA